MAQRSEEGRSFRCLVCAARVGQLVPFCEWCGAKHAFAGGGLVLTGAICQECGFQAAVPFSYCPQCRAQRRILCPNCAAPLAVRQTCNHCGLHFLFFDKVRREHSHADRRPRVARMSTATRKLMFIAFVVAVGLPLSMGHDARWFALGFTVALIGALAFGLGAIRLPPIRGRKRPGRDWVALLETHDPAETMAARAWLRLSGMEAQTVTVPTTGDAGSPSTASRSKGLRRVMVARPNVARAAACLSDHGFELSKAVYPNDSTIPRWGLRLVHNKTSARGDRSKERDRD
jgi:hypothetical protein